jgi:hypothetical protein
VRRTTIWDQRRIVLRPLSSLSLLPSVSFLGSDASLVIDEALSFSATRVFEDEDEKYYELAWASPEEIALFASITVGASPYFGKAHLFPARWPVQVLDEGQDLSDPKVLEEARGVLIDRISDPASQVEKNDWVEHPPLLSSRPYQLNGDLGLTAAYQSLLFRSIDRTDPLIIRGLAHLLKTAMLKCLSRTFVDTGCLELYVALEASLQIILRTLRQKGFSNPSNRDASDYLLEAFGATYRLDKYYEEFYEDRIKAVHPNSRFGSASFTPLYVDDLFMLYNDLLRTFEFLITGKPNAYEQFSSEARS